MLRRLFLAAGGRSISLTKFTAPSFDCPRNFIGCNKVPIRQSNNNYVISSQRSLNFFFGMSNQEPKESRSQDSEELEGFDDEKRDGELLKSYDSLREAYSMARKNCDNKWLGHMSNCHVYLYRGGGEPSNNLAAFDLDGTIIKPKSNKRIPRSATDWQFFSVWTKGKVQQAIRENHARFVMFTNQYGVGLKIVDLAEIKERVELVTNRLNIPCTVFVATEKDEFRKPNTGMYTLFTESFNDSLEIDLKSSFYCGDAVGYPSHSDADIKFAQRLGLPFLPPEKFLRGVVPKIVAADN